jgi:ribose transport system substrate-binding protein
MVTSRVTSCRIRTIALLGTGTALAVTLAACGSSGSGGSGSSDPSGSASSATATSAAAQAGMAAAKAYMDQYLKTPTSVGITQPLTRKPAPATVAAIEQVQPEATQENDYLQQATNVLGLKLIRIRLSSSPQAPAEAMDTALKDNPKVITDLAQPVRTFESELAQAKARGIPVMETSDTDHPGNGLDSTGVNNQATTAIEGKMAASWFVVDSGGKGLAAVYNIPEIPILGAFTTSFVSWVKKWCPGCTTSVDDMQAADIGTNIPNQVVSFQQSHPTYKYAIFCLGDMTLGLHAALQAAGLEGKIKIAGQAPAAADLQAIRDGTETMWTAVSLPVIAWRNADTIARLLIHQPLDGTDSAPLPTQILTKATIGGAKVDKNGNYVGIANYEAIFKKLWHIGS